MDALVPVSAVTLSDTAANLAARTLPTIHGAELFANDSNVLQIAADSTNQLGDQPSVNSAQVIATVADLSAHDAALGPVGEVVWVNSYAVEGACGGWFEAINSGTAADGGTVFAHGAGGSMRWQRLGYRDGAINVCWFSDASDPNNVRSMPKEVSQSSAVLDGVWASHLPEPSVNIKTSANF